MKQQLEAYMLTKPEISALREVAERQLSISEVAKALNKSSPLASLVVKSLKEKGFVETSKGEGAKKIVTLAPTNHAQYFADLIESEPYVPWEDVLSYSKTKILLEQWLSVRLGRQVSKTTEWRALRYLAAHGMLAAPVHAALNSKLRMFIQAYADYASRTTASRLLPQESTMIWRKGEKFLFKTKSKELSNTFGKTAITMFPKYGIKFIADEDYYFYDPNSRTVSLEDILLHSLLIDPSSPTNNRYALFLLAKETNRINQVKLKKDAGEYELATLLTQMKDYLQTKGDNATFPFPKWDEFRQLASDYDIEVD